MHARLQNQLGPVDGSKRLQGAAEDRSQQLLSKLGNLGPTALGGLDANRDLKQRGHAVGIALALIETRASNIAKANESLAKS